MSLTLDPKKAKISKRRHGEQVAVHFYRERGFLPWAFVNFLVLLGWSTSDSQDIFSRDELIEAFTLEGLGKANAVFDIRKDDPKFFTDPRALSINAHYIRTLPLEEIAVYVRDQLEKEGIWDPEYENGKREWFLNTIDQIRKRYHVTTDFVTHGRAYFSDEYEIDPKAMKKNILKHEGLKTWLPGLADRLKNLETYSAETIEDVIRNMAEELEIKPGVLINGIRTAVTGQPVGPGIFDILIILGQGRVVERLYKIVEHFNT